ncbi:MAG: DUF6265 family protein [Bacteroidota bacterium]
MQSEKDIFRQFGEQQDAWDETPATGLWDQLEARLDAPADAPEARPRQPYLWIVAGVVLLLAGTLTFFALQPQNKAEITSANTSISSTTNPNTTNNSTLNTTLNENTNAITSPDASLNENANPTTPMATENPLTDQRNTLPARNTEPVDSRQPKLPATAPDLEVMLDNVVGNAAAYNYNTANIPLGNMVVTNNYGNPIDTVHSLLQYRGNRAGGNYNGFDNSYLQLNIARNDISFTSRNFSGNDPTAKLQHLNWLLGSWKNNGPSGATYEEWTQVDEFTIEGRGFFVVNGDTMTTEKMRIEERGEDVYYIVAIDSNMRPIKFRLRSRKPNELVFENPTDEFPREIIVRQSKDNNNFETILQKGDASPDNTLQTDDYLRTRNAVRGKKGKVIRNMSRDGHSNEGFNNKKNR